MNIKKIVLVLSVLLIVLVTTGCENKEPQYDIYENHDISACGVNDPLRNLDWLAEFTANYKSSNINVTVHLYANIETKVENIVMIHRRYTYHEGDRLLETMDPYYADKVYSCSGECLFVDPSEEAYEGWTEFFHSGKNESQGIIWHRYRIN